MIVGRERIALAVAAAVAVAMPLLLLPAWSGKPAAPVHEAKLAPLALPATAPLADVYRRPLFAAPADAAPALPQDAPQLVGIVGRLDVDAVALVRTADGTTRTLRIGESIDGWQLASLAIDAAFFTRGAERVRVPLPPADAQ